MTSARGIVGIIGIRAEIIGVRQYLADGREIERINDHLAASTKRIEASNAALNRSQVAANAAFGKAIADRKLLTTAIENEFKAEQKLDILRKTPVNRNVAGRFITPTPAGQLGTNAPRAIQADIAQATKELAFQQSLRTLIGKGATQSAKEAIVAGKAEGIQIANNTRLLEQQAAVEAQLAAAKRSRLKAAATTVAIAGTAIIGATAAGAITSAAKYQQELSKINVLTSATDEQTQQLGQSFLKLSTEIPVSASDLAAAAYKLLSSGIKDTGQALEITTGAAKAAVAGQADIKDIISATIAVLNGYPKGAITAAQVNDILFAGVKEGSAEFNDFAGSIGKLIPIAAALNVPFDQLTASLAVLTNGGLNAEEAATGLRAILNDLAKDENSKQAQEALAQFGLTVSDVRKKIRDEGLPQAMGELITLFNGNLAAIEPIIPNIRGMVAAFSAFQNNGKTTIGVLSAIDKAGGIVDQSFAKTKDNAANLAKIFSNQVNVALIEIGNAVLPAVTKALQDLNKWVSDNKESITKFVSEGLQGIIDVGKDVAQGIGVIADALDRLDGILKSIVGQSDLTKVALAAIGTGLLWALPGGPIIVGLIAITTLLSELTKQGGFADRAADKLNNFFGIGNKAKKDLSPEVLRPSVESQGSIEKGVRSLIGGNDLTNRVADDLIKNLKSQGFDVTKGVEEFDKQLKKINDAASGTSEATKPLSDITLPKLTNSVEGVDRAAKKTAEELKKLAEEFLKSSEAAGEVESFTTAFKKFGEITKKQADAFGLSAAQAGAIQGVDAVIRAQERSQAEAFNYVEAINAVSEAWRRNSAVGRQLLFDLAQASLEASQKALSDVFSRPTREVANLNVGLARQQFTTANRQFSNGPQIRALQQQLEAINRQISQQNRANTLANRAAERAQRAAQAQQKAQQKAAQDQLDAQKLANLQAQIAAERQLAALQKLIDATTKQQSDLQETFKKNNEALRKKFFEATSRGDEAGALSILDEQQKLTKAYHEQNDALTKQGQQQTTTLKLAQEAEAERQRQQQLADALFQSQQRQQESTDSLSDSLDAAKEAQDAQTQAMEDSKQAIQDQIDALQGPIDQSKEQEQRIQETIAVYEAQTNVMKALGVAADQTLFTQQQQTDAAIHFIEQIGYASNQAKNLADNFYAFIPGAKDADLKFQTLRDTVNAINTNTFPGLVGNFDAVTARLDLLKKATEDVTTTFNNSATQTAQKAAENQQIIDLAISNALSDIQTQKGEIATEAGIFKAKMQSATDDAGSAIRALPGKFSSVIDSFAKKINSIDIGGFFKGIKSLLHAQGGIFTKPTLGIIGEAGPEVVLPLNDSRRTSELLKEIGLNNYRSNIRTLGEGGGTGILVPAATKQIMAQMSPGISAALVTKGQSSAVFAPNITVTGETLDTMEATALAAVRAAFRDARLVSGRTGGLITTGLGPSH